MIRYLVDASATRQPHLRRRAADRPPGRRAALSLPVWIPGSYLVREFARHLSALGAEQAGRPVPVEQIDKATWVAALRGRRRAGAALPVYAFDLSVRAPFLDAERGFFNGTGVCLRVEGREGEPHRLALAGLAPGWQVATTLPPSRRRGARLRRRRLRRARRPSGRARPLLARQLHRRGIAHEFVVAGALPDFDGETLLADTKRICETAIAFWHGGGGKAPFDRYLFLLNAVDEGRGGLEHRASTALVAPRRTCRARRRASAHRRRRRGGAAAARRGLHRPARPDLARVLPRLERQAAEAARLRPARLRARELHPAALVLRGLHLVLRRPAAAAQPA
jgi:predicted metalloprotease with PDZ domain